MSNQYAVHDEPVAHSATIFSDEHVRARLRDMLSAKIEAEKPEWNPNVKRTVLGALIAGFVGDVTTTNNILSRRGGYEINPLLPDHRWANTAMLSGEGALAVAGINMLYKKHPKWATLLGLTGAVMEGVQTYKNIKTIQQWDNTRWRRP